VMTVTPAAKRPTTSRNSSRSKLVDGMARL
jgi:hypothetical protein